MLIDCQMGYQGCRDVRNLQTFMSMQGACLMLIAAGGALLVIAAPFERQGALDLAQDPLHRANALLDWHGASTLSPGCKASLARLSCYASRMLDSRLTSWTSTLACEVLRCASVRNGLPRVPACLQGAAAMKPHVRHWRNRK